MVDEVVAERQQNKEELHCHGGVPGDRQNVVWVVGVWNNGTCRFIIDWGTKEGNEDDPHHRHEEELDADQVSVKEGVVLARDGLLELDQYHDQVDSHKGRESLNSHNREVDIVSVV